MMSVFGTGAMITRYRRAMDGGAILGDGEFLALLA
jgi:hypothetical protein